MNNNDSDTTESSCESYVSWENKFLSAPKNSGLVEIPRDFLVDRFNLIGINKYIPSVEMCLKVILEDTQDSKSYQTDLFYYLAHQRYIFTRTGLEEIFEKVMRHEYGVCRNVGCSLAPLIPLGLTDVPNISHVKIYCYNCKALFQPVDDTEFLDSCAFGRSFPHFFMMTYKTNFPKRNYGKYIPRVFGFRLYEEEK